MCGNANNPDKATSKLAECLQVFWGLLSHPRAMRDGWRDTSYEGWSMFFNPSPNPKRHSVYAQVIHRQDEVCYMCMQSFNYFRLAFLDHETPWHDKQLVLTWHISMVFCYFLEKLINVYMLWKFALKIFF